MLNIIMTAAAVSWVTASLIALRRLKATEPTREKPVIIAAICGALFLTALLAIKGVSDGRPPVFGRFEALTLYALAIFASYLHLCAFHHLKGISALIIPYITVLIFAAAPALNSSISVSADYPSAWVVLHVATAFAGYGFFTTASILAVVYLLQDYNLKQKNLGFAFQNFPSLEILEQLMRPQIVFAFMTFTASIAFGIVITHLTGLQSSLADPKVAATGATWLVYAVLLYLRIKSNRHGKKIAIATVAGLIFVLFAFFGIHFIADSSHDFVFNITSGN